MRGENARYTDLASEDLLRNRGGKTGAELKAEGKWHESRIFQMGKLNKKEYKFLPAFWLVTVILAIVVGLSYANRIKYSNGAVAGWFTPIT